jgi:hypothetical protein
MRLPSATPAPVFAAVVELADDRAGEIDARRHAVIVDVSQQEDLHATAGEPRRLPTVPRVVGVTDSYVGVVDLVGP